MSRMKACPALNSPHPLQPPPDSQIGGVAIARATAPVPSAACPAPVQIVRRDLRGVSGQNQETGDGVGNSERELSRQRRGVSAPNQETGDGVSNCERELSRQRRGVSAPNQVMGNGTDGMSTGRVNNGEAHQVRPRKRVTAWRIVSDHGEMCVSEVRKRNGEETNANLWVCVGGGG